MSVDRVLLQQLEVAARNAAMQGGIAAMGYYRGALAVAQTLGHNANAATVADVQATLVILRNLAPALEGLAGQVGGDYSVFSEELDESADLAVKRQIDAALPSFGSFAEHVMRSAESFSASLDSSIGVLFDGLDGTTNFRAGLPLFCTAVAVLVDRAPRVGAIYDPHHHVVYYGSLDADGRGRAHVWTVANGFVAELPASTDDGDELPLLATHLTRSDEDEFQAFAPRLIRLASEFGGTYMLNSGQLALAYLAAGNLSAFINSRTKIWDVAAGEVLVKAVGGRVTDFSGGTLTYGGDTNVSVAAARTESIHSRVLGLIGDGK